ncbi:MAG: rane-bound lytic murein transglycosylase MltD, partial [Pseudomonadota bacterium]
MTISPTRCTPSAGVEALACRLTRVTRAALLAVAASVAAGCASLSAPLQTPAVPVPVQPPAWPDAPVADAQPRVLPVPTQSAAAPPSSTQAATPAAAVASPVPDPAPRQPVGPVVRPEDRPEGLRGQFGAERVVDTARADLWERVRGGFAMADLDNDLVRRWERWYAERPDYVERMMDRGARYLFHIVEEVNERGMPMELVLLPFIESAFNPEALSRAQASGMWQFMPATGRSFDLKQNIFRDDRRSVLASTRAALDYLQSLHRMFGDWHLALAAYNWGQGNVTRAIARNERARLGTGYGDLRMPDETRNYVPKLQAVKNIVARPEAFGLKLPKLENHPFFLTVPLERDIDVALVLQLSGLAEDDFRALNPQLNKPVVLAAATPSLLLPYDPANRFVAALARHTGPLASWTAWVAPRTMPPKDVAGLVGMREAELRDVNRIPPKMLVRAGSTLLVRRKAAGAPDVSERVADEA